MKLNYSARSHSELNKSINFILIILVLFVGLNLLGIITSTNTMTERDKLKHQNQTLIQQIETLETQKTNPCK